MKMSTIILFLTFIGTMSILIILTTEVYHIEYYRLSLSISYGKTLYLLPNLFSPISIVLLLIIGGLLLLYKYLNNRILFNAMLLLISSMIMFAVISFLSQAYVTGDQPRAEFALGSLIAEGKLSLKDAELMSTYFRWPSLWIFEGIFSVITGLSPFETPVFLMIVTWLAIGLVLTLMVKYVHGETSFSAAITAFLLYSIFNPYKIIHLCPQIYAIFLLLMVTLSLLRGMVILNDPVRMRVTIFILVVAIIVSHPLTSVIAVSILLFILIRSWGTRLVKGVSQTAYVREGLVLSAIIFFTLWNIRFEDIVREIALEFFERTSLQSLEPITGTSLYSIDTFYKAMALFRYTSVLLTSLLALSTLLLHRRKRKLMEFFFLIIALSISSLLFNFIPGTFFHRILYYLMPFIAVLSVGSLSDLQKSISAVIRKASVKMLAMSMIVLMIPLLSQISIMEFITNNNPLSTLNSPFEFSLCKFIANFYVYQGYLWSISSGAIGYYIVLSQERVLSPYTLSPSLSLRATYLATYLREGNLSSTMIYLKTVYPAHFFVVSPRERYTFYERTIFEDFHIIDHYLNRENNRIYDNKLFRLYEKIS